MRTSLLRALLFGLFLVGACSTFDDESLRQDINVLLVDTADYLPITGMKVDELQHIQPGEQIAVVSRPNSQGYRTIHRGRVVKVIAGEPPDTTRVKRRRELRALQDQLPAASIHHGLGTSEALDSLLLAGSVRIRSSGRDEVELPIWKQDVFVDLGDADQYQTKGADAMIVIGVIIGAGILIGAIVASNTLDSRLGSDEWDAGCLWGSLILLGVGVLLTLLIGLMATG